jgi:fructose-specific phosphotransferase system IIC component
MWFHLLAGVGLMLGFVGVGGLIFGTANLFRATQLSVVSIRQEARLIRERQKTKDQNPNPKIQ